MSFEYNFSILPEEIHPIRDLIADTTGIYYEEKKYYFLEKRILRRMHETDNFSAKEYFRLLKLEKNSGELQKLIHEITTNETYFYRSIPQLDSFVEEALPMVLQKKRKNNDFTLNIWSAASSSGEEAYTIAILLREFIHDFHKWNIHISGTDIDLSVLEKAKKGIYQPRSIKDVPSNILNRYFEVTKNGTYRIVTKIKSLVTFEHLNLMDRISMRTKRNQDFVFCRNVLIYFKDESKRQVVSSIYDSLNTGGFIFLGHSESVGKLSAVFKVVQFKKSISYQK